MGRKKKECIRWQHSIHVPQAPHLSNQISLIHRSRIKWKSLSCQQFRLYSYQILVTQALPHDTKLGNCRCKIVDSRAFPSWSLIHGLRWSGLIKAEPGARSSNKPCFIRTKIVAHNTEILFLTETWFEMKNHGAQKLLEACCPQGYNYNEPSFLERATKVWSRYRFQCTEAEY